MRINLIADKQVICMDVYLPSGCTEYVMSEVPRTTVVLESANRRSLSFSARDLPEQAPADSPTAARAPTAH
jgi:hypothetical protein